MKKVEAKFSPAEAKPGQTVTFTVTIELNDGYHTYPTVQADKQAAAMVNEIKFPNPDAVIFVGKTEDPKDTKTKAEPDLGILELRYCTGTVTYTRKAVVSPKAAAGATHGEARDRSGSACATRTTASRRRPLPSRRTLKVLDGAAGGGREGLRRGSEEGAGEVM